MVPVIAGDTFCDDAPYCNDEKQWDLYQNDQAYTSASPWRWVSHSIEELGIVRDLNIPLPVTNVIRG